MKVKYIILIIFFFSLIFRAYFVYGFNFADGGSYYNIKVTEYMLEHKKIFSYDELSYNGKKIFGFPLFYFILLPFRLFGDFGYKLFTVLMPSLLIFIVYFVVKEITTEKLAIVFSVLTSAFIPSFFINSLNILSVYILALLLILYALFCFMRINERKYLYIFILLSFILSLLHPISLFLGLVLLFYLALKNIETSKYEKIKREVIIFFVFLALLIQFIIFKEAFLDLGIKVIWGNVPKDLLDNYFKHFSILDILYGVGIIPFLFGSFGLVIGFREKRDITFLFSSLILGCLTLLVFKLINFNIGLMFLGIALAVVSSLGFEKLFKYFRLTKFAGFEKHFTFILFLVIVISLLPGIVRANSILQNSVSDEEIALFKWVKENTIPSDKILALVEEGHYITSIADRKGVMDEGFLGVKDIDIIYNEVKDMYTSQSEVKVLSLLKKYSVDYIYFSYRAKDIYLNGVDYGYNKKCFRLVKEIRQGELYKFIC